LCPVTIVSHQTNTDLKLKKTDFDVVVIGGGAAGLTASATAVSLGAKTLMVEADRLGGDCTWFGCVPSKALLSLAELVRCGDLRRDDLPARLWAIRERIYQHADTPERFEALGMEVLFGRARFTGPGTLAVACADGTTRDVTSRRFILCAGTRPALPPVEGLEDVPYKTTHSFFEMKTVPDSLVVLGAGAVGVELGQACARMGVEVILVEREPGILPAGDPLWAHHLDPVIRRDGVRVLTSTTVTKVECAGSGTSVRITARRAHKSQTHVALDDDVLQLEADMLLVATGREPATRSLGLEIAGVATDGGFVKTDATGRTSNRRIYAAGDVTGKDLFTHAAGAQARAAAVHAVLRFPRKYNGDSIPKVVYTHPECASLGMTSAEAARARTEGKDVQTWSLALSSLDRAVTDGHTDGTLHIQATRRGRILGATLIADRAGELIGTVGLAMQQRIPLSAFSELVVAYPTWTDGLRKLGTQQAISRLPTGLLRLAARLLRLRGPKVGISPDEVV